METYNIISYPRSGQHLLQSIIEYVCKSHNLYYKLCLFYKCCKEVPCAVGGNFCKNHDLDMGYTIKNDAKYIVLYRKDIVLQLEAQYRNIIKRAKRNYKVEVLRRTCLDKKPYYVNFVRKWVMNKSSNIHKIEYYDLVNNPKEVITKLFGFLYPNLVLNETIINAIPEMEFTAHGVTSKIRLINKMDPELYKTLKNLIDPNDEVSKLHDEI